jgi:hypothetical protein
MPFFTSTSHGDNDLSGGAKREEKEEEEEVFHGEQCMYAKIKGFFFNL